MNDPSLRLDPLDQRLLLAVIRTPGASFAALGERLDVRASVLSARYRRMRRAGVIQVLGRTLPGFGGRRAYLVRAWGPPARIARTAREISADERSRWVRISRDGGELMCGRVTDDPATDPVLTRGGAAAGLGTPVVAELLQVWSAQPHAVVRPTRELDELDHALLQVLSTQGRAESSEVARALHVDPSTVSRRRRRLIEEGVLYLEADVHPAALDGTADAMLWMRTPPGRVRASGAALRADERIRFCAATSGTSDLVAHVHVADNAALLAFIDEQLAALGITEVETVPMGAVLKRNAI